MSGPTKRGRGRPKRQYRIRVRGERRERPDYDKIALLLLEHAAIEDHARREKQGPPTPDRNDKASGLAAEPSGGDS